ncbi:putative phosphoenolpyruvate synthase, partial [Stegodyphus mimosarum]
MVKGFNEWRKAFRHLAKLMVSEGRIPEEDLLFFMTIDEVKELLNTRSPKIIARATQRLRRHPVINKYIFPEIMKGIPKPVNLIDEPIIPTSEDFMMTGVPVSQGVAEGAVRVALTLEEASYLKPGEILLTYGTDIGWTPYFPMLAGVVTELGGLISHGAVVSREYGIPCIAGLHEVTRNFQTGDYVRLDGYKGILQKIPRPENT